MISSGEISVRIGMLPEMNTTDPYSPTARANASAKPVSQAGIEVRQDDARQHRRSGWRPRLVAASSTSGSRSSMTGCSVRTTNGRPMKISAIVTPSGVNATLIPYGSSSCAEPAVRRVDRRQRDAGHRGRQRERQVDQRVDDAAAGKRVAHQHPRDEQAEHRVDAAPRRATRRCSAGTTRPRADR